MDKLKTTIKEKHPHLVRRKVVFHQDNATYYTRTVAILKLNEMKLVFLPHPPYAPDLAPGDFFISQF